MEPVKDGKLEEIDPNPNSITKKRKHDAVQNESYHGETTCDHAACTRKAYYSDNDGHVRCGYHSDRNKRQKLLVNPKRAVLRQKALVEHQENVKLIAEEHKKQGKRGTVTCTKMRMMQNPDLQKGQLLVFPNNRHDNRSDGFGCAALSPMRLGPVKHKQPALPNALTIENYHQYNKHFPQLETMEKFRKLRTQGYQDPVPHRHKYDSAKIRAINKSYVNGVNTPVYSIHLDATGKERKYTYVESRFFYCYWYETLAKQTKDYVNLVKMLDQGYNLNIVGYDAYEPREDDLYTHYCDASRPFGHEMVLHSLLVIQDPRDYPWQRYYHEHKEKYDPVSFL